MKTVTSKLLILLLALLFVMAKCEPGPSEDDSSGGLDDDDPTVNLCENLIKDEGEEGIDCGGTCPDCFDVEIEKELLIRHLEVVESDAAKTGDLSFGKLMERLSPTTDTKAFILSILTAWETDQLVNDITVPARPSVSAKMIDLWKTADTGDASIANEDWEMNLENAPFHLLAITNRIDLNNISENSAGEGRLTFGLNDSGANVFTWIFEYNLAATEDKDVIAWAKRWHALSALDESSEEYLSALTDIVSTFTSGPDQLNQIRTNEVLGGPWELREFNISSDGAGFDEVTRKQSPDVGLDNSRELQEYVTEHQEEILAGTHVIEDRFGEAPFMAGNTTYGSSFKWTIPGFAAESEEVIKLTAMSCNGCHGGLAEGTRFTHIKPRSVGTVSTISPFLSVDLLTRSDTIHSLLQQTITVLPDTEPVVISRNIDFDAEAGEPEVVVDEAKLKDLMAKLQGIKRVH